MDYRRWCWWAEWGLVAAVLGLHGVVFWAVDEAGSRNHLLLTMIHDAQVLVGIVLMIGWSMLGPGWVWVRVLAIPAMAGVLLASDGVFPRGLGGAFFAAVVCSAALMAAGVRLGGLQIANRRGSDVSERGAQFSLLSLILAMTAIAAVFGALESLRPTISQWNRDIVINENTNVEQSSSLIGLQVRELVVGSAVMLTALMGAWVVMAAGTTWLRMAAAMVFIPATSIYLAHLTKGIGGDMIQSATELTFAFALIALISGISVLPLRVMGFRLQRRVGLKPVEQLRMEKCVSPVNGAEKDSLCALPIPP